MKGFVFVESYFERSPEFGINAFIRQANYNVRIKDILACKKIDGDYQIIVKNRILKDELETVRYNVHSSENERMERVIGGISEMVQLIMYHPVIGLEVRKGLMENWQK